LQEVHSKSNYRYRKVFFNNIADESVAQEQKSAALTLLDIKTEERMKGRKLPREGLYTSAAYSA
jgi:hypothetical protein